MQIDNLSAFKAAIEKYKNMDSLVVGNGPSTSAFDFEKFLTCTDVVSLSTNRISLIYDNTTWRPDIYVCFCFHATTDPIWKKSIIDTVSFSDTICVLPTNCRSWLGDHKNVHYFSKIFEHYRHSKVPNDLFDRHLDAGFLKSYTATMPLFQISHYLNSKSVYLIGQDGYHAGTQNHFCDSYGYEPTSFDVANKRLIDFHTVLKIHTKNNNINILNMSSCSILKMYDA